MNHGDVSTQDENPIGLTGENGPGTIRFTYVRGASRLGSFLPR